MQQYKNFSKHILARMNMINEFISKILQAFGFLGGSTEDSIMTPEQTCLKCADREMQHQHIMYRS